eukprot:CAMPEP_0172640612 /NCGR_PEP_ID=MMETSP1068-20121228/223778_1 /TAXON_ID=35684 /ORGANISM="Pseudopedinella elastica, Strain CCMP716" /LENGTH=51 /DNA_ID=CAMNT_0013454025 /DNA_START=120 /DNA_END=275 /DNA_ORIENTATION=+
MGESLALHSDMMSIAPIIRPVRQLKPVENRAAPPSLTSAATVSAIVPYLTL